MSVIGYSDAKRRMRAQQAVDRLASRGFCAHLDPETGALLITDMTGRRRDPSRVMPLADMFATLLAGLGQDPGLLPRTRITPLQIAAKHHGESE